MRNFRKLLALAALCLVGAFGLSASQANMSFAQTRERPNIIFVLADDLDAKSISQMPLLKSRLIDEGTTFDNAFVTDPLCCPSRATILRGQYAHNHQVTTHKSPDGGFEKFRDLGHENSTMATWLQTAGYRTVLIGKYLNNYDVDISHVPPGWDEWYGSPAGYYNYSINENGTIVDYMGLNRKNYSTDVFRNKAVDYIKRTVDDPRPFFMYLAPKAPHTPAIPALRDQDAFPDAIAPRPPSFNEEDVSDKPTWVQEKPLLTSEQLSSIDELYGKRLRSMLAVDQMLWYLIKTLRETNQLDNTYIFFTSDHGFHMGQHRLTPSKWTAYEEDIRFPLIVRGPGVPKGQTLQHMVLNNDFGPTFAALAGASTPDFVDGYSFKPLLTDDPPSTTVWRKMFLVEADQDFHLARPPYKAIRTGRYLYVEYEDGDKELYDLSVDPYELENLQATSDPALIDQLHAQLEALSNCSGESCRVAEDWTPDTTSPTTTATTSQKPNENGWNSADLAVTLRATDEGISGIREISYSATGAQVISPQTTQNTSAQLDITTEGETTIAYHATDYAGNVEAEKTLTVLLDKSAPEANIDSGPEGPTTDNTPTFTFSGTDNLTQNGELLYSYKVDDGAWSEYSAQTSVTLGGETGLADGPHSFSVRAKDRAGNEDGSPAERSFTVDTTSPIIGGVLPAPDSTTSDLTPTISAKVWDAQMDLTKANIELFFDGRWIPRGAYAYDRATDQLTYTRAKELSSGNHRVKIIARDDVGLERIRGWTFTVE